MQRLELDKAAPKRPYLEVLFDVTKRDGLILHVPGTPRSKRIQALKDSFAREAASRNANVDKLSRIFESQVDEATAELDKWPVGWRGMTPRVLQELLFGSERSLDDAAVERMEASLKEAGETEYEFSPEVHVSLLEDAPVYRERLAKLANDIPSLVEAEAAYRRFFSAGGSGGRANEAA